MKNQDFIEEIKNEVFKPKIKTFKELIYFEDHVDELFEERELLDLIKMALKEYVKEMGWEIEYSLHHAFEEMLKGF